MKARRILIYVVLVLAVLVICVAGFAAKTTGKTGRTAKFTPKITAKQANAIVLKKYHGKIQGKTKLENEEGKWQYGVMVLSKKVLRECMVNATTGHIDSVEITTAAKEGLEEKADAAKPKGEAGEKGEANEKNEKGETE